MRARHLTLYAFVLASCGDLRQHAPESSRTLPAFTYLAHVKPLLDSRCAGCHGDASPEGQYSLSSWQGLLGPGSDRVVRNAVAGDPDSLFLSKLTAKTDEIHGTLLAADELDRLRAWVVEDELAFSRQGYHPAAWLYPADRNSHDFHGGALRARGWDTSDCEVCHGADLRGGPSGKACYSCHQRGVNDCTTCHGAGDVASPAPDLSWGLDPRSDRGVGAHAAHAETTLFSPIGCDACHSMPATVHAVGHLFDQGGISDLRAEVAFSGDPRASHGGIQPQYNAADGTCTVYCHAPSRGPERTAANWAATAACDGCHSVPMAGIGGADCSICHQQSVERCQPADLSADCLDTGHGVRVRFLELSRHGDGMAPLGKTGRQGRCHGCHGTEESDGAPAPDLRGREEQTWISVGLHQLHLTGERYRAPLPCDSCHLLPQDVTDDGHLDSDLPAEIVFSSLATGQLRQGGSRRSPLWNREKATCSNTHCHSLGGGTVDEWRWTRRTGEGLSCDSCHGMPPTRMTNGGIHTLATSCSRSGCHQMAYRDGELDPTKHINGVVEVGP